MKKEHRNLVIGLLLGILLTLALGAKTFQRIDLFRVVRDNQSRAVLIDMENKTATYIEFRSTRLPNHPLMLSDKWSDTSR